MTVGQSVPSFRGCQNGRRHILERNRCARGDKFHVHCRRIGMRAGRLLHETVLRSTGAARHRLLQQRRSTPTAAASSSTRTRSGCTTSPPHPPTPLSLLPFLPPSPAVLPPSLRACFLPLSCSLPPSLPPSLSRSLPCSLCPSLDTQCAQVDLSLS